MRFLRKYWYICFGVFALAVLEIKTSIQIYHYGKKEKKNLETTRKKSRNNFLLLSVIIAIPTLTAQALFVDPPSSLLRGMGFICFYLSSIVATYLHARWREKHLGHLLKKRGGDD